MYFTKNACNQSSTCDIITVYSIHLQERGYITMKDKKRLSIGLMIHYLDNDYSKILLRGASSAAEEADVNLVIMPGRSLNCQLHDQEHTEYEYQYNVIYNYACAQNLDALIISAGTVGQFVTREEFKQFIDGFEGLPVLTLECEMRGYPCVRLAGSGIKSLVSHLIEEHGKRNIAFVSGPKGNSDANERLAYYREALEENGIPYDESLIAYGKFSEYCVDIVGDLLDRNKGRIDAICFANDMMCKGGYKAIEERGLVVGKDIAVIGYDDSEIATALNPMLTTVRADAAMLGAYAVKEAIKLANGDKPTKLTDLGSNIVTRHSCGCATFWSDENEARSTFVKNTPSKKLADMVVFEYLPDTLGAGTPIIAELLTIMELLFEYARNPHENDPTDQIDIFDVILAKGLIRFIHPDAFIDMLKSVRYIAVTLCDGNYEKIIAVHQVIEHGYDAVTGHMLKFHSNTVEDLAFTQFLINNIAKDMTANDNDEEKCFFSIVNNLYRAHMASTYIYTFPSPVLHANGMEWDMPPHLMLKAYHDGDKLVTLKNEQQILDSRACITNPYTPDRRRTFILFPLFMNEEQYGVIAIETQLDYYSYIYSIAPQICTAIKLTRLVDQLESSLDAATSRNTLLNKISMYDELTGVYNRRGFYEFANSLFTAPENEGKHAVLIFADLDDLKKINDHFGHDAGDYAITSAAGFLKSSLRNTDIVARIGGDEFAAFAICETDIIAKLPQRIKSIAQKHNCNSDKEFNVCISVGTYTLTCSPSQKIQSYMDKAHAALYEDKKLKSTGIFKQDSKA